MSEIIERVETFIQRLHDRDYVIAPETHKIWYSRSSTFPSIFEERKTLSDYLANAISEYQENRDNEQHRLSFAKRCNIWINRAFTTGVIQEGKGLVSKNKELKRDIKHLRKRLNECNKRCQTLEEENKRLHNLIPKGTFTGDIQGE